MKIKPNPFVRPANFVAALALALAAIPADAANLTWTTTPGGTITEGGGTWTTGSAGWWTGAANANWAASDNATFGGGTAGTAGTVTLGGNITANKITFNTPFAGNYTLDLAGKTLTTPNVNGAIAAGNTTTTISDSAGTGGWNIGNLATTTAINNAAGGLVTVNAKITGAGNMNITGGGAVTLTNDANNFTGHLSKQNGNALTISSIKNSGVASAAGAGSTARVGVGGIIIYNGTGDSTNRTLELFGTGTATLNNNGSGALIWTGPITHTSTANKTFTLGGSNTANNELQGALTNNGTNVLSVTKADAGTWVLSGNNTYTGLTTVSLGTLTLSGNNSGTGGVTLTAGTLNINSATALGATASALNINGGTIDNTSGSANTLANNNPITLGGNFAYGTAVGTAANNLNLGTGTVSITGSSRTITLNGAGALTFGGVLANTAKQGISVTVNKGLGTTSTSSLNLGGVSITSSGDTNDRNFNLYGDGNINVTGAIVNGAGSGLGSLYSHNTGTLTLSGANTYTGGTFIESGTIKLGAPGVIPDTGTVIIRKAATAGATNGVLDLSGNSETIAALTLGSGSTTAANAGQTPTVINTGGAAVLTLGDTLSYEKGSAGFENGQAAVSADIALAAGSGVNRNFTIGDSTVATVDLLISGVISSDNSIQKGGAGTLRLTNANTYSRSTIIDNGAIEVTTLKNKGTASSLGTGNFSATTDVIRMGSNTSTGTLSYIGSGDSTDRRIQIGTGITAASTGGAILLNNGSGTLTFTNSTFNSQVNTGTGTDGASTARTLTLGGSNTGANTIQGVIADNTGTETPIVNLFKQDAGTWVLSGNNTYTGLTTVSGGTLAVNGSVAGAMSVASGATLQGNGTISGATTVSGNLKPGNSPGLLTFANSLTLDSTAVTTMEITGANSSGTRGTTYDAVNVTNALTYGGTLALNFDILFTQTGNYTFSLFDFNSTNGSFGSVSLAGVYSGSFTNNSGIWDLADGDNNWSFNQGDGVLTFTVVPEPNVAMVVGSLALMTLLRRRRH
jgi:autotransporter-associated beta strand protein